MNLPTSPIKITPANIDTLRERGLILTDQDITEKLNVAKDRPSRARFRRDLKNAILKLGYLPEDFIAPFRLRHGRVYIFDSKTARKLIKLLEEMRYEEREVILLENGKVVKRKEKVKRW